MTAWEEREESVARKTFATFLNGIGMSTLVKKCGENYFMVYNWANSAPVSIF